MKDLFIHYGSVFNYNLFNKVKNCPYRISKPNGGFWVSPIDSKFGWKDFLLTNDMINYKSLSTYYKITIQEDSKILKINNISDIENLPKILYFDNIIDIDFEKLSSIYDVLWLTYEGYITFLKSDYIYFHTWDCESLLIFNDKCINNYGN